MDKIYLGERLRKLLVASFFAIPIPFFFSFLFFSPFFLRRLDRIRLRLKSSNRGDSRLTRCMDVGGIGTDAG